MENFNYQGINLTYNLISSREECERELETIVATMLERGYFNPDHVCSINFKFYKDFFLSIVNITSNNEKVFKSGKYLFEYDTLFLLKGGNQR